MPTTPTDRQPQTALIVGASRGLGHALAAELLKRGWRVIGTVRPGARTDFHTLADDPSGLVEIETLDITDPEQIAALRDRLSNRALDMLFVNAGTTADDANGLQRIGGVSSDEFVRVMITNTLSPMRVIEALEDLVPDDGLIGVMSSGQGSIGNNEKGSRELYRGSKAALNMFMRSFAARERQASRAMLLLAPGWIRTDLGGPEAPFTLEESAPKLIDVLLSKRGRAGLEYLDRDGLIVPW
jgi:NAD(P)-dependent dehydrogenase (short-subunit alcohol dehydrogenase family)